MFEAVDSPWLAPFDGHLRLADRRTRPPKDAPGRKALKVALREEVETLRDLQEVLYASDQVSVLLVFQAMDAAGKDSTIRAVMSGVNPAGCQVYSFKKPSTTELDHDFLWRTSLCLPERGRIGIFNRSYYEEVLVVRVHPQILEGQRLPWSSAGPKLWEERLRSIAEHERHLARNGTVILKFFLNVSKEEQRQRFLARIDERNKNWKFSSQDVKERAHWDEYQAAYEAALSATSRSWAPWYVVPADNKRFMRLEVARLIVRSLKSLDLRFPVLDDAERDRLQLMRDTLTSSGPMGTG
jgi:PPK2 family polyphosphate:nucleotide phosphotransferase